MDSFKHSRGPKQQASRHDSPPTTHLSPAMPTRADGARPGGSLSARPPPTTVRAGRGTAGGGAPALTPACPPCRSPASARRTARGRQGGGAPSRHRSRPKRPIAPGPPHQPVVHGGRDRPDPPDPRADLPPGEAKAIPTTTRAPLCCDARRSTAGVTSLPAGRHCQPPVGATALRAAAPPSQPNDPPRSDPRRTPTRILLLMFTGFPTIRCSGFPTLHVTSPHFTGEYSISGYEPLHLLRPLRRRAAPGGTPCAWKATRRARCSSPGGPPSCDQRSTKPLAFPCVLLRVCRSCGPSCMTTALQQIATQSVPCVANCLRAELHSGSVPR
jgi:hypothetical protein